MRKIFLTLGLSLILISNMVLADHKALPIAHCDTKLKCKFIPANSFNFTKGRDNTHIDALIIHYTVESLAKTLSIFEDPHRYVSAHYIVDTKGNIIQLVREQDSAYHAGRSEFNKVVGLNRSSIGIEVVNKGYYESDEVQPINKFTHRQISALERLCKDIIARYHIPKFMVLGHEDIALGRDELDSNKKRKIDPGPYFPWKILANDGIGLFPSKSIKNTAKYSLKEAKSLLDQYGYATYDLAMAQEGFQIHFNPNEYINKIPFSKMDIALLHELIKQKNAITHYSKISQHNNHPLSSLR